MSTEITVFFTTGEDKTFVDENDRLFDYNVNDGHLRVTESVRRIPGKEDGLFKEPRPIHVYPPGVWREVEVDYGYVPTKELILMGDCEEFGACVCGECKWQ